MRRCRSRLRVAATDLAPVPDPDPGGESSMRPPPHPPEAERRILDPDVPAPDPASPAQDADPLEPDADPPTAVPPPLGGWRGAAWSPPYRAATVLVLVALLAAVIVAVVMWRGRPRPVAGEAPVPLATVASTTASGAVPLGAGPSGGGGRPTATPTGLVVAVVGKVRRPGLVTVAPGSRLVDAVAAAGGALPGVDLTPLNLARRVSDGEQIVVGAPAPVVPGGGPAPQTAQVNLNTAAAEQLETLPGVGPVLAQRIIQWRDEHGGFQRVEQLQEVAGIGSRTFDRLRDRVTL